MAGKNGVKSKGSAKKSSRETIMVICAHSDDQILGVGGTMAKYAEEGKRVIVVVASYGEKANPWLKKEVTAEIRAKESEKASRIVGAEETVFLGFTEGRFMEEAKEEKNRDMLIRLLNTFRPERIFMHSTDDPHPDHNALAKVIIKLCDEIHFKGDILSFDVWNPVKIHRNSPKVYIDITLTFSRKMKALKCFRSQLLSMLALEWSMYVKAIRNGFRSNTRFAELFYKVR